MTEPQPLPLAPDELAGHVEFVRRLARGLVRDAAASEDLAQEAWVAALERPSPLTGSLRAWLARVLRNRAALALRRGERRTRREAAREADEAGTSTAEIVERMELHGRVVAAVLALPDSYRELVVRRYFRDESPSAIAERLDLPEATVRTRLARAHERLRQRLDTHFGGERSLAVLALARLARDGAPPAPVLPLQPLGVLSLVMKKAVVALAVAVLALVAVWSVSRDRARGASGQERVAETELAPPADPSLPAAVPETTEVLTATRAPVE